MEVRAARVEDAPALGRVMVASWLTAHRGQVPDAAWQVRAEQWTPAVSARGWARVLTEQAVTDASEDVLLLAEDESGEVVGLIYGVSFADGGGPATAEVVALYVAPARQREGIGTALLRCAGLRLADLDLTTLRLTVLEANHGARRFYEAAGGVETSRTTVDEEGHLLPALVVEWSDISRIAST